MFRRAVTIVAGLVLARQVRRYLRRRGTVVRPWFPGQGSGRLVGEWLRDARSHHYGDGRWDPLSPRFEGWS